MSKVGIRVAVRTRPTASFAQDKVIIDPEKSTISVDTSESKDKKEVLSNKKELQHFQFHNVLHNSSQDSVYNLVTPMINSVLEGYNATIMAYGQTGAGKTYTMLGRSGDYYQRGIIPRCLHQIFEEIEMRSDMEFHVCCSYMEIYNEKIFDLLSDRFDVLDYQIVEEPGPQGGIIVRNLLRVPVISEEETLEKLFKGNDRRTISEHNLNKKSNRSHCIFTLYLEQQSRLGDNSKIITSKLHLVDLAGSERMKNTIGDETIGISSNPLVKESLYINSSLSYLEQCVVALSSANRAHIPYRQSKLTYILRDSLGGNCKTLLIACIYCEYVHLSESISTLRFASRMMRVKNINLTNVVYDSEQLVKKYESQIKELKAELMLSAAFSGKSTEVYSELTDSQKTELGKRVRQFVDCNENEEEGILDFNSLHQVKEIFKQFKLISKQLMQETANKIKSEIPANINPNPIDTKLNETKHTQPDAQSNVQGMGELNTSAGFSIGRVADDARPLYNHRSVATRDTTSPGIRALSSTTELSKPGSPSGTTNYGSTVLGQGNDMANTNVESENTISFDLFKGGDGRIFYKNVLAEKEQLNTLNYEIKILVNDINIIKDNIDSYRQKIESKKKQNTEVIDGQRVVDEEEYNMVTILTRLKKEYQTKVETLLQKKQDRAEREEDLMRARRLLLEEFEKWSIGGKGSNGLDNTKDDMDYGEQFERMQMENDLASDPNSVPFYNAQRRNLRLTHKRK